MLFFQNLVRYQKVYFLIVGRSPFISHHHRFASCVKTLERLFDRTHEAYVVYLQGFRRIGQTMPGIPATVGDAHPGVPLVKIYDAIKNVKIRCHEKSISIRLFPTIYDMIVVTGNVC